MSAIRGISVHSLSVGIVKGSVRHPSIPKNNYESSLPSSFPFLFSFIHLLLPSLFLFFWISSVYIASFCSQQLIKGCVTDECSRDLYLCVFIADVIAVTFLFKEIPSNIYVFVLAILFSSVDPIMIVFKILRILLINLWQDTFLGMLILFLENCVNISPWILHTKICKKQSVLWACKSYL